MRKTIVAIVAAICPLAWAQPTPDKPLEETKKNIKVLRGVPSSQLIPTMAVMANSLGVSCAYCHEPAWESDAKPAKEAGRRMLRMTRAMNEQYYSGKVVITCMSCHQGHVVVPQTPLVSDAGWNKAGATSRVAPPLPSADELFAKYVQAWGARDSVSNRLSRGVVSARSGRGDPRSAGFEMTQELPDKLELKTDLSYPPDAEREIASQFFNAAKIRQRYASVETTDVERIRGRDAYAVRAVTVTESGAPPRTEMLYFDSATGVLLRRHRESPTIVGALPEEFDFDDYRTVDRVLVPFFMQWSRGDYQVTHQIAAVKQNVPKP